MIADVEIKRIDFLGSYRGQGWHGVIMLNLDTDELMAWETYSKVQYHEGEKETIVYSERFAEQDILSDTRLITDVRRYKRKQIA